MPDEKVKKYNITIIIFEYECFVSVLEKLVI